MKTDVRCMSCFLNQVIRTTNLVSCSEEKKLRVVQEAAALISTMDSDKSPVANARPLYEKISELTGCKDPYLELKRLSNKEAMKHLPLLRSEYIKATKQLECAVRFAIAGNIIDYGALATFDLEGALIRCRKDALAVDHLASFENTIASLHRGADILYLADNCGEIVCDSLLLEYLVEHGFNVTVAVKDGPIINDALIEDALYAGLDKYCRIVTNGTNCPGTVLDECSDGFCDIFNNADLVIAKGQGNFESLSEIDRDIFFLLTVKCGVAAKYLIELSGVDPALLPGKGEMAVYYSGKNN